MPAGQASFPRRGMQIPTPEGSGRWASQMGELRASQRGRQGVAAPGPAEWCPVEILRPGWRQTGWAVRRHSTQPHQDRCMNCPRRFAAPPYPRCLSVALCGTIPTFTDMDDPRSTRSLDLGVQALKGNMTWYWAVTMMPPGIPERCPDPAQWFAIWE